MPFALSIAGAGHVGGRMVQEDVVVIDVDGRLAIVADGSGGVCTGLVAANIACAALAHRLAGAGAGDRADDPEVRVAAALREASALVFATARDERLPAGALADAVGRRLDPAAWAILDQARDPRRMTLAGMFACVAVVQVLARAAIVGHVGDVRVYRRRGGEVCAVTDDHVLGRAHAGLPTALARTRTRTLGGTAEVEPDVVRIQLEAGDTLLICTDGVHQVVPGHVLAGLLASAGTVADRCAAVLARALADGGDHADNLAAVVIDVGPRATPS